MNDKQTDYITHWNKQGTYGATRIRRMIARKAKRRKKKGSPNICPKCKRDTGEYVEMLLNPYYWDMNNTKIYERMCSDCCSDAAGDI